MYGKYIMKRNLKCLMLIMAILSGVVQMSLLQAQISDEKSFKPVGTCILVSDREVRIPFEMVDNKPVMDAEINGVSVRMTIDNGRLWDQIWMFGSPVVDSLGILPKESWSVGGAGSGDSTEALLADDVTISFPGVAFHGQECIISPPSAGFTQMFPKIDGQVSNTLFSHFQVEFDFDESVIVLHPFDTFKPKDNTIALPLTRWEDGGHSVPMKAVLENGKELDGIVDLDLGGIKVLKLVTDEANGIVPPEKNIETILGYGAQGPITGYYARIKEIQLGSYTFDNEVIAFGKRDEMRIEETSLGVIGLPLLSRFNIVFDYREKYLYLTPNKQFNKTYEYDMTGLKITGGFVVKAVAEGTAGQQAGVEVGDHIQDINGIPTEDMGVYDFLDLASSKEGRVLDLLIKRGEENIRLSLTLQRRI